MDSLALELAEWDTHDAWFTPGAVVEQGLHAARILGGVRPRRILDLGAGAGVFLQRAARAFPGAQRMAVEIRRVERRHLDRHAHQVLIGDMFERRMRHRLRQLGADFIVSNPPYFCALEALQLALATVRFGGWVLFFVRQTFGSSAEVWRWLMANPAAREFTVAGRPNMRSGLSAAGHVMGGDMVGHTWLLFRHDGAAANDPEWPRRLLPPLESVDLGWRVRPGTELHTPSFSDLYLPLAA
jgi:hypothetical protein